MSELWGLGSGMGDGKVRSHECMIDWLIDPELQFPWHSPTNYFLLGAAIKYLASIVD